MSHIFISYSRVDIKFAGKIVHALAENKLDTWIDWKSIPKGEDWEQEIYRGIEEADAFLFLISPDSVASAMCNKEIVHAVKNGKRILPIVIRDAELNSIHSEISKRNWIFCRDGQDDFNKAIEETRKTIHTDYEWLKYHTDLQVKALKWEQTKDASRLLRGKELREGEERLAKSGSRSEPQPTDIQRQFILQSQRNELRLRRRIINSLVAGVLVMLLISTIAIWQWQRAEEQANVALSRQLAAFSLERSDEEVDLALLLGTEAYRKQKNILSLRSMINSLQSKPELEQFLTSQRGPVLELGAKSDQIITVSIDGYYQVWNYVSGQPLQEFHFDNFDALQNLVLSENMELLAGYNCKNDFEHCTNPEILIWTIGQELPIWKFITPHTFEICAMEFLDDNQVLVSVDCNGNIIWWSIQQKEMIRKETLPQIISGASVSKDGQFLVASEFDHIVLFDIESGITQIWAFNTLDPSFDFVVSPNNDYIIATSGFSTNQSYIYVLEMKTGYLKHKLTGGFGTIFDYSFSIDEKYIAAVSSGGIFLWDIKTGRLVGNPINGFYGNIVFSSDGNRIIGSFREKIEIWNPFTNPEFSSSLVRQKVEFTQLSFNKTDSSILTSLGNDGNAITWDLDNDQSKWISENRALKTIEYSQYGNQIIGSDNRYIYIFGSNPFGSIETKLVDEDFSNFSLGPSSNLFATIGKDFKIWNLSSGKLRTEENINDEFGDISIGNRLVKFSPSGSLIAVCIPFKKQFGTINLLQVWSVSSNHFIFKRPLEIDVIRINQIQFTSNGNGLIMQTSDGTLEIVNIFSNEPRMLQRFNSETLDGMVYDPSGEFLATPGKAAVIRMWDNDTGLLYREFQTSHTNEIQSIDFSPDGKLLASASKDFSIRLWGLDVIEKLAVPLLGHYSSITTIAISKNKNIFSTGGGDGKIIVWDLVSGNKINIIDFAHKGNVRDLEFLGEGNLLVSIGDDQFINFWDFEANTKIHEIDTGMDGLFSISVSESAGIIVVASPSNSISVWDLDALQKVDEVFETGGFSEVFITSDDKYVIGCSESGKIIRWKIGKSLENPLVLYDHSSYIFNCELSTDNRYIASGSSNASTIIDIYDRSVVKNLPSGYAMSFSPDGKMFVTTAYGSLKLWDLETMELVADFTGQNVFNFIPAQLKAKLGDYSMHYSTIGALEFSKDGNFLITGGDDNTVRIWDMDIESWIIKTCQRAGRNFTQAEWSQYFPNELYRLTCPQWPAGE